MTTGALLFAYNTEHIDYVKIAAWSADNIKRHLGIPVAIVTDVQPEYKFDQVIIHDSASTNQRWFGDIGQRVTWRNDARPLAYELTPWERTLLLDVDYVVASDRLKTLLDSQRDFLAHRWAYDISDQDDFRELNYFGNPVVPMWWATVLIFDKTVRSKMIFDCMQMVRDNWAHYRNLYQIKTTSYRNDHALSIALGIVDGHTLDHDDIPWPLASLVPERKLKRLGPDHYRIDFVDSQNRNRWLEIQEQDFHAMGKTHLEAMIADHS